MPRGRPDRRDVRRRGRRARRARRRPRPHRRRAVRRGPRPLPARPGPHRAPAPREPGRLRLLSVGGLVERKGIATVIEALAALPGAELVVAGGPAPGALDDDPEVLRLHVVALASSVTDLRAVRGQRDAGRRARPHARRRRRGVRPLVRALRDRPARGRPRAGIPSWARPWAGCSTRSSTGARACSSRRATPGRCAAALRRLADDPAFAECLGSAARLRAEHLYGWVTVAERTAET